jgi:hypothetical protein
LQHTPTQADIIVQYFNTHILAKINFGVDASVLFSSEFLLFALSFSRVGRPTLVAWQPLTTTGVASFPHNQMEGF